MPELMKNSHHMNASGHRIRQFRLSRIPTLSQTELANSLIRRGVPMDQTALSRVEARQRSVTDLELIAFAKCLKVSVAVLCGERKKR